MSAATSPAASPRRVRIKKDTPRSEHSPRRVGHEFQTSINDVNELVVRSGIVLLISDADPDIEKVTRELRLRGFSVRASFHSETTNINGIPTGSNFAVTLSRKLIAKLALQNELPVKSARKYSPFENLLLGTQALQIIRRATAIRARDAWQGHHSVHIESLSSKGLDDAGLSCINAYYGPHIALYFSFLQFYTRSLIAPALAGLALFMRNALWAHNEIDSVWLPLFCVGLALWGTYFLETWKRRCAELAFAWKVFGVEDNELTRELAKSAKHEDATLDVRRLISWLGTAIIIYAAVRIMLYYNYVQSHAEQYFSNQWYAYYLPVIIYSVLPFALSFVFDIFCEKLNDFEHLPTQAQAEASLVVKKFAIQFVNKYCALLYAAFWLKDLDRVTSLCLWLFIMGQILNNAMELGIPLLYNLYHKHCDLRPLMRWLGGKSRDASAEGDSCSETLMQGVDVAATAEDCAAVTSTDSNNRNMRRGTSLLRKLNPIGGTVRIATSTSKLVSAASNSVNFMQRRGRGKMQSELSESAGKNDITSLLPSEFVSVTEADTSRVVKKLLRSSDSFEPSKEQQLRSDPDVNLKNEKMTKEDMLWHRCLQQELSKPVYDIHEDYMEMVIQFGYLSMFAVAFPVAPSLAYFNNIFEAKVDLTKLSQCRRPNMRIRSNIGAWQSCLEFLSFIAVLTNCYLLTMVSTKLTIILPLEFHDYLGTDQGRLIAMIAVEHILLVLKVLLMVLIDDVPQWMQEALAREKLANDAVSLERRMQELHLARERELAAFQSNQRMPSTVFDSRFIKQDVDNEENGITCNAKSESQPSGTEPDDASILLPPGSADKGKILMETGSLRKSSSTGALNTASNATLKDPLKRLSTTGASPADRSSLGRAATRSLGAVFHTIDDLRGNNNATVVDAASPIRSKSLQNHAESHGDRHGNGRTDETDEGAEGIIRLGGDEIHDQPSLVANSHTYGTKTVHGDAVNVGTVSGHDTVRLMQISQSRLGFSPVYLMLLIGLPPLLQHFDLSPWLYVPLAIAVLAYMQNAKDRHDRKAAVGIISDPALIKYVIEVMPSWVSDSETQRVEWLNALVQKLWPELSIALEKPMIVLLQQQIDSTVAMQTMQLIVKRFSLGSIAPKIVGVRIHSTSESVVRMDVELRWAGDPVVAIHVRTFPITTPVELNNVRLSATVRIELLELMCRLPCFRALSITCMKRPTLDFSLKVGGLDVMNVGGTGTYSVASIVTNALDEIIKNLAVYPKKIIIPVDKDMTSTERDEYGELLPCGIPNVTFERATNLKQVSIFGVDPYVVAATTQQEVTTHTVYSTFNPVWEEPHQFLIYDTAAQQIDMVIWDYEMASKDRFLGRAVLSVQDVVSTRDPQITITKAIPLQEVDTGELVLSYSYIPIRTTTDEAIATGLHDTRSEGSLSSTSSDIFFNLHHHQLLDDESDQARQEIEQKEVREALEHSSDDNAEEEQDRKLASLQASRSTVMRSTHQQQYRHSQNHVESKGIHHRKSVTLPHHLRILSDPDAVAAVTVSKIRIRGLRVTTSGGRTVKPYVVMKMGGITKRTEQQVQTAIPVFTDVFSFIVRDIAQQKLKVRVKHRNWMIRSSTTLGELDVPLREVVHAGGTLETEHLVTSAMEDFYITFRMVLSSSV